MHLSCSLVQKVLKKVNTMTSDLMYSSPMYKPDDNDGDHSSQPYRVPGSVFFTQRL